MTAAVTTELPLQETVAPADERAVAAVIARARQSGTPVYPIGGGTSLDYGPRPERPGIGLCMGRLNRVLDHPADDLTITVEPGLTLAELNRRLAEKRQWLPIDAPQSQQATLGGILAVNAFGPRRCAYGTIGDYVIGIRAIDGCGEAFAGGGRVVKNAAGYNIPRLMVGSLGTLGVITQLTLMVRPLPAHAVVVVCDVGDFDFAECLLAALGGSQATPTLVEMLAGPARPQCPLPALPGGNAARLVVGFEGCAEVIEGVARRLCDEWQALGADRLTTITGAGVDSVWNWLSESPATLQVNVLPSRLVGVIQQLSQVLPAAPLQAHAQSGVAKLAWPADRGADFAGNFAGLVQDRLRPIATAAGGHLTVLAAPAECGLTAAEIWGPPRPGTALMRAIQQRFDPAGILNPGRLL